ncbi:hypothetical protein [Sulfitobacter guttiformis]|uniref:Uncharacterized protein n=1 Tax=Sulfitobacter guttiformis TaxID=74349 RepID=A0A420DHS2_9RHOB|nr:hypothetical protein [Sulfitobacter guttiformis]KIN72482.1 hypothetical protein Z949_1657 [Sulfitobacter guttiformis KCTC 32187]RKE93768.1 hypothetical protein C8N30_2864 [Sulfitobacter guttiformis]
MFTKSAFLLSYLIATLGIFRITTGFLVVNSPDLSARYLGTTEPGSAIDGGIYYIIFAVGLGVIAEMSRSLKKLAAVEYK